MAWRSKEATQAALEDALFMFATGESPEGVARRLGVQPESLVRFFQRHHVPFPFAYDAEINQWVRRDPHQA